MWINEEAEHTSIQTVVRKYNFEEFFGEIGKLKHK
jgi:hypothetical protein